MSIEQVRPNVLPAASLIGNGVVNAEGEDLGKVEQLMIDIHSGRVAYAVLSFGGFLGLGDKLFAIPWQAMTVDTNRKVFVLHVDRMQLQQAPGFDKNHWPEMSNHDWLTGLFDFYGYTPYWEGE